MTNNDMTNTELGNAAHLRTLKCDHCPEAAARRIGPAIVCQGHGEAIDEGRLLITLDD